MVAFIITVSLGVLVSILGGINMTGNISSLHWYHRQRITEENRKPFGRLVGFGTLLIGLSIIAFGVFFLVFEKTKQEFFVGIGTVTMLIGIIAGLVLSFYAMIKYNKGIF